MRVKEKPDIIDIIERKRLQWYGHVKRMQEDRIPKLIMEWIPGERRKRGRPRKTWMEGVRAAMKTRHLEANQWLNRKEWCLGSGRRRQLSQDRKDRQINPNKMHMLQSLFYLTTALHVSGVTITHLQEHKATVTTASGNRYTVLLSAAIVEELDNNTVCTSFIVQ